MKSFIDSCRTRQLRSRRYGAAVVTLVLLLATMVMTGTQTASAAAAQLPFTVTNNSGRADTTYIYVIARNSAGQQGYVDGGGAWHAYPFPASIPAGQPNPPAPDVSIPGPGTGASTTITLPPSLAGGRIYLSMGAKLQFFMTTSGLVEPAPWVSTDPNANTLYDWTEFSRASNGGDGIFINSTTVDMFSLPMSVQVTSSAGATDTEGITGGRSTILNGITGLGGPWANLVQTRASDGLPLRALAPVHAIANGNFSSTYLDAYIADAWTYYQTHVLSVDTAWGTYTGQVSGTNMLVRNATGGTVGTLPRPSTSDVFGCSGAIQPSGQPDEPGILAFGARVCAAFHRATLSTANRVMDDHQPTTDPSQFYQQSAADLYSKVIHANSLNGRAYGFAYDDVGGFAPTIDQPDPASAGMTIGSFGTATTTPPPPVSGATIAGPGGKCVDVAGDDVGGNAAAVQLWDCQAGAADQHWTWNGATLRTLGRCMDVTAAGTANGTLIQLYDCNGSGAQSWAAQSDGSIENIGSGKCLDSPGAATANGTRLEIWDCNGTAAQKFSVTGTAPPIAATQINGPGGKCVDVAGDNTGVNNAPVQLWACQGTAATDQQWTWNGTTLRTLGRCLDVTAAGTANGTLIQLYDCNGSGAQNWQQVGNTLVNPASGRCLDSPGAATADGTRLEIWDCNGTGAQYFVKAA